MKQTLTQNETSLINELNKIASDCYGEESAQGIEINTAEIDGFDSKSLPGIIGSLVKKGIIEVSNGIEGETLTLIK